MRLARGKRNRLRLLSIALAVLSSDAAFAGAWSEAAPMHETRQYPGLARLADGRILAVTGHPLDGKSLASAEIYDPKANTWTPTGALNVPRNGVEPNGLIVLPSGKVLLAGGGTQARSAHEAEVYDPATGIWTLTGSMAQARGSQSTVQLRDGRVLVMGGIDWSRDMPLASCEVYDERTGEWSPAPDMSTPRYNHDAVRLRDGRVLVGGGASAYPHAGHVEASVEIYDPATDAWTSTGAMHDARRAHRMVLLHDGRVLAVGGAAGKSESNDEVASTEIYDPATGTWTPCAPLSQGRWGPTATVLPSGKVLVTGGMYRRAGRLNSAEVFDPATGVWSDAGNMKGRRNGHRDIVLDDGRVLIVGGFSGMNYLATCEMYSE